MPSWNEKSFTVPTINVNLKPCTCGDVRLLKDGERQCFPSCPGAPVSLPCPIPPSVTLAVRLGECIPSCAARGRAALSGGRSSEHYSDCPARPIRVICFIGGDGTWAGSEVVDVERMGGIVWADFDGPHDRETALRICRERWALVKALLTRQATTLADVLTEPMSTAHMMGLLAQRDAVFSKLCEMAQAEQTHEALRLALAESIRPRSVYGAQRPSEEGLARYLTQLLEQVGVLR